jgi:uncharacterized protein RhaS with RHS repeats
VNYISQDPIGLSGGNPTLYGYVSDPTGWLDVFGLSGAGQGGAYMFSFVSGDKYIGKKLPDRMKGSISQRTNQVKGKKGDARIAGKAYVSTNGNNDLGKMVEYKAMLDAGFAPGGAKNVPDGYLNGFLSGKSTWDANPKLQAEATRLATQLKDYYLADVESRKKKGY